MSLFLLLLFGANPFLTCYLCLQVNKNRRLPYFVNHFENFGWKFENFRCTYFSWIWSVPALWFEYELFHPFWDSVIWIGFESQFETLWCDQESFSEPTRGSQSSPSQSQSHVIFILPVILSGRNYLYWMNKSFILQDVSYFCFFFTCLIKQIVLTDL